MLPELRSDGPIGRIWVARLRPLAAVTLVFVGWWAAGPWNFAQAMELERLQRGADPAAQRERPPAGPAARLADSLEQAGRLVERIHDRRPPNRPPVPLSLDDRSALRALRDQLTDRGDQVVAQIEATGRRLAASSLPDSVQARQRQKLAEVERGLARLRGALRKVERSSAADLPAQLAALSALLQESSGPSLHNPLDPDRLPFRPAEVQKRGPRTEALGKASGPAVKGQTAAATAPTPADLAATPEVQLTPGITALAESLGSDPLAIYNWVRQNIRFVPTFGSIQGAQACLLSRECNAYDTASLLIALLRASGVPARYVEGTVEVEPDLFRSALGDFTDIRAAARLASSGGIPTVLVSGGGGEPVGVRMEHVWVEAFVDYLPGRGAGADSAATWVPLDASLKPTSFRAPMDLASAVGGDLDGLVTDLVATATVGNGGSSATGLSEALATSRIDSLQTDIADLMASDLQDATVGDVLGAIETQAEILSILPGSLPARALTVSRRTAALTPAARHQITIRLVDRFGLSEQIRLDTSTVELAGKRVTLGYLAATPADVATIESFGGLLETPPYLVDLTPVLYVEGEVAGTGPPVPMGTSQKLRVSFREPDGRSDSVEHVVTAGTYAALGLDLQRVSETAVGQRSEKLAAARDRLGKTEVPFDDVMGEVLNLHSLSYFLQVEANNHTTANQLDVVAVKRPAEMLATYSPVFAFTFGSAVDVVNTGMNVDVRRYIVSAVSRTGDRVQERNYVVATGTFGSLAENTIFEQMHNTSAVSAIRLLAEANNRNIPIFVIDQTNVDTMVPQLDVSTAVVNDIRNAVAAGKQVITPREDMSFFDWNGVGYVVLDLATGAAAYLISGGLAGGGTADISDFLSNLSDLMTLFSFIATIASFFFLGGVLGVIGNLLAAIGVIAATWYVYNETGSVLAAFTAFLYTALAAIYLAAVASALVWSIGLGTTIAAAIAFYFVVTVIVTAIVVAVLFLLTHLGQVVFRRRDLAEATEPASRSLWSVLAGLVPPVPLPTPGLAAT